MRTKHVHLVVLLVLLAFAIPAAAQQSEQTRSITSDDFANNRPGTSSARPTGRRTYRRVRVSAFPAKRPVRKRRPKAKEEAVTEIGVTMWKLRPPKQGEAGYLLPVLDDKKVRQMWLAERFDIDSVFKPGDKIRFAIESSQNAYLYVIDRESFADGRMGEPFLIFPESPRDDNAVGPGVLVDIPDQRDDNPYFNLVSQKPGHNGELLTIIISPTPLPAITTDRDGKILNTSFLSDLEFGGEAELFSRTDKADILYSKNESETACGTSLRKTVGGCGVKTRQLKREEPLPQSIYRVKTVKGEPAVAFVKMSLGQ